MNKPKFYIDIDNTVWPLVEQVLYRYNNTYNDNLKFEDITSYEIKQFLKPECKYIWREFCNQDLFDNTHPYENAVEALEYLNSIAVIKFATAGFPETMEWRDKWLAKYFGFYKTSMLIRVEDKPSDLNCDFLLDDCLDNVFGGEYRGIIFDMPWNRNITQYNHLGTAKRIKGWGYGSQAKLIDMIERKLERITCGKSN